MNSSSFTFNSEYNKFITKSTLFFIVLVILFIALEVISRNVYSIKTDIDLKKKFFEKQRYETELLIFGPSSAEKGINPKYLDLKSFNLAADSQDIEHDFKIFQKIYPEMKNLKAAMIKQLFFCKFS